MKKETENKLDSRNIKPTAMRQLVFKALADRKVAISLPELERMFEKADKSTLYRTLKTFEEGKIIHKIDDGTGAVKYALCHEACECEPEDLHVHFICSHCKNTYCLNEIPIPEINLPVDFTLESVNMVVKGICMNCQG